MRKVFLEDLPRWEAGTYKGKTNWKESIGHKVKGVYKGIEFEIEIVGYKHKRLFIKYLDKSVFEIDINSFKNCNLGNLLGIKTGEFKIKIGTKFKDDKRDFIITDREIRTRYKKDKSKCNDKYYKYKCNKCGNKDWILESGLVKQNTGCNTCCSYPQKNILGINTIWDKARWMCDLGVSEEDAKTHTPWSNKKIYPICPDCGRIKDNPMSLSKIYEKHSISCTCSDKVSYPNKFAYSFLAQLNEIYKFEYLEHEYSPDWIKPKRYDNYFIHNGQGYILEMDGEFHFKDNSMSGQTKEESKAKDNEKDLKAKEHGIEVIRIDSKISDMNYIKQNILCSEFNKFDLNKINWLKCEESALSNRVKEACELWDNGVHNTKEIGKIMKIDRTTVIRYLKKGNSLLLNWCNYDAKAEVSKNGSRQGGYNRKQVKMFKDGMSLGIFSSYMELERQSIELFGIKLVHSGISQVASGRWKQYKGFTFKYINEIEQAI